MKRTTLLLFFTLLVFFWSGFLGEPLLATAEPAHRLQCVVVKGKFLAPDGSSIHEYDYLEPDHKYRLLPRTEIQLSTLDGNKSYVAVGPGILLLNSSGSVLFNGNPLKPKTQQSLLHNVAVRKSPSRLLAGLPFRGVKVVARTANGETRLLPLYSGYNALVVGVGNYDKWPKLPNAVNDAKQVAKKLKTLGFHVNLVLNPTIHELKKALNDLTYRYGRDKDRALLLFYAGHGETEVLADGTKLGYIIPRDCPLLRDDPHGFVNGAISMRDIEAYSLRIRSKHVLMLFDSCFSGALFSLVRAVPSDITEKSAMPVRQYITAGTEDEEVPDRSMFKRCLLIGLNGDADLTGDGYITGSELGMYLADKVVNYTHRRQHPQYGKINNPDLDRGDFILVPPKTQAKQQRREELSSEKEDLLADVRNLRTEREETHRLLREMKQLLQKQQQAQQQGVKALKEKNALENQISQLGKERETIEQLADTRVKEYEAKLSNSTERVAQEAEKRNILEAELTRIRLEKEKLRQEVEKAKARKIAVQTAAVEVPKPKVQAKTTAPPKASPAEPIKSASLFVPEVKPGKGAALLVVTSNVKDAEVYIDKKEISFWAKPEEAWIFRGTVPFRTVEVTPGKHEIRVHKDEYLEEVKTIHVRSGETIELDVTLYKNMSETGDEDHGGGGGGGGGL